MNDIPLLADWHAPVAIDRLRDSRGSLRNRQRFAYRTAWAWLWAALWVSVLLLAATWAFVQGAVDI